MDLKYFADSYLFEIRVNSISLREKLEEKVKEFTANPPEFADTKTSAWKAFRETRYLGEQYSAAIEHVSMAVITALSGSPMLYAPTGEDFINSLRLSYIFGEEKWYVYLGTNWLKFKTYEEALKTFREAVTKSLTFLVVHEDNQGHLEIIPAFQKTREEVRKFLSLENKTHYIVGADDFCPYWTGSYDSVTYREAFEKGWLAVVDDNVGGDSHGMHASLYYSNL